MFSRSLGNTRGMLLSQVRFQSTQAYKDAIATLKTDLKLAMREKNQLKRDTVKGLLSAIKNKEIDTKPSQHNEFLLFELYSKAITQRKDSAAEYLKLDRAELAEKEQKEIEVIKTYLADLPVATQEEIDEKVKALLEEIMKDGPVKIGQVFGKVQWDVVKNEWKASESAVRATIAKIHRQMSQ